MKLSPRTDTAIKLCLYLDVHRNRLIQRGELAYAMDRNYTEVGWLLTDLAKTNIGEVKRGRHGGFRMMRKLNEIGVAELIALGEQEQGWEFTECDRRADCDCIMTGACSLNAMFRQLQAAFMEWAEGWTLADLSNPQIIENAGRKAKEWAEAETEKGRKYH